MLDVGSVTNTTVAGAVTAMLDVEWVVACGAGAITLVGVVGVGVSAASRVAVCVGVAVGEAMLGGVAVVTVVAVVSAVIVPKVPYSTRISCTPIESYPLAAHTYA